MLIGIAGKTGSGKNHVASMLEERGWRTLDLDLTGHEVLESLAEEIEEQLGPGLLNLSGRIDRKILGSLVFSNPEKLNILEKLTYPWIEEKVLEWLDSDPDTPAAIHAINLHKTDLQNKLDAIIWVKAPKYIRKKRVINRDTKPWKELKGRFRSQNRLNPKLFFSDAEIYSVRNSGNDRSLSTSLDKILSRL